MLQVLLHSFTTGFIRKVAKVTNGNDTGDCYGVGHHPTVTWVSFAFQWEKTLAASDAQAHCAYLRGIWMVKISFSWLCVGCFFLGCFFRRNPDVAFLFQRPPNDGRKSVTIQVYSSSTTLRWGSGAQQSKVMKWWNQKCPTKTGVVFFRVGIFHDPKTGRESIKYLPRVHGNSSGWSYWYNGVPRKRYRSEKHDLFIRDRLW